MSNTLSAGKEIVSFCPSCGHNVAHTIIFMKTPTVPGRVECKSCKKTHTFKESAAETTKTKSATTPRKRAPSIPLKDIWEKEIRLSKKQAITYSPKAVFQAEDLVDHSKFGLGIVKKLFDQNKIEVMFQDEIRTLVHKI